MPRKPKDPDGPENVVKFHKKPKGKHLADILIRDKFLGILFQQAKDGLRLNGTKAYIEAGGSPRSAASNASEILRSPEVQAQLRQRVVGAMDQEEILQGLSLIARGKRASKVVIEDGEAYDSEGNPVPVRKTRKEYDRKGGFEAMARVRGLLKDAAPSQGITVNLGVALKVLPHEQQATVYGAIVETEDQG